MYRATPTITGIDISFPTKKKPNNFNMTFTSSDMQSSTAIQINTININAFIQQILHSFDISSTRHEQKLHGRVKVLRHRQLILAWTPPNGVQRRLATEAEPLVVLPRVQR